MTPEQRAEELPHWSALRMVREAIEAHAGPGALPPGEVICGVLGPETVHEAEYLVAAIVEMGVDLANLRAELAAARLEGAIEGAREMRERCAEVAETLKSGPIYWIDGKPNAGGVIGGKYIAEAIHALPLPGETGEAGK